MTQPFWSPAYKKPLICGFGSGFLVLAGLLIETKHIAPSEDAKLIRGWQVSGKYFSDTSRGRRNTWATKIGEEYVVCFGNLFGGKTDCPKFYEGKLVTATRVVLPSVTNDHQLVIAELKEGPTVLYSFSDAELIQSWKSGSFRSSLSLSFFIGLIVGIAFAIPHALKPSEKK